MLHEGDEVKVKVLEIHPEEHRIALSIKALEEKPASEEETKNVESYELPEENTGFTMGDILGDALKEEVEEKATDDSEKIIDFVSVTEMKAAAFVSVFLLKSD